MVIILIDTCLWSKLDRLGHYINRHMLVVIILIDTCWWSKLDRLGHYINRHMLVV